jgi:DNA-binding NtrC family response regulator
MLDLIENAKMAAASTSNVLIEGESGTGKELFAQSIHNYSRRSKGPFIALNCGAIPRELIGSELFGYAEGAFTGARKGGNPGKFELASGGTIFLDEIGDMPFEQQAALLRVIQDKSIAGWRQPGHPGGCAHYLCYQQGSAYRNDARTFPPGFVLPPQCDFHSHPAAAGTP